MEPNAQKIMMQAAKEAWRYSSDEVLKETDNAMKTLKARANLKVYEIAFGSKEWKRWRDVMFEPAKAKLLEIGGDMTPKILEIVKQYE